MREETKKNLKSYLDSLYPILYIRHSDFADVDKVLREAAASNIRFCEFNNALGAINFSDKHSMQRCDLVEFLSSVMDDNDDENEFFIVLKDVHKNIDDPKVIALLRRIAELNERDDYHVKIIIVDSVENIPQELKSFITLIDVPLPDDEEIMACLNDFADEIGEKIDKTVMDELAFLLKGLSAFQIKQVLSLAYQNGGGLDTSDIKFIMGEKEQIIKKSGILEMVNFKETLSDIGGLENLKNWLKRKEKIFAQLDKAIKYSVDIPRGILILGMPGCEKSLAAKATAALFKVPLIRLTREI